MDQSQKLAAQYEFDLTIGRLDRILSELMGYAKAGLDAANLQTMKHHIEDMELLAAAVRKRLNFGPNSQAPAVATLPKSERPDAGQADDYLALLSTELAMLPGAPSVAEAVREYIKTHESQYKTEPDATVRPEHAGLGPVAREIKAGRCFVMEPNLVFKNKNPYGVSPTRDEAMAAGPERPDAPLPPPSLEAYAAVWNGLVALTLPGNPLAALNGVRMADFPERLAELVAGMEGYPYSHVSNLEEAVKGMLDAFDFDGGRLVGVMYEAREKLEAAYNAKPSGELSPTLREYANFWLGLRQALMQPGKPCHGLAMVPMEDVPRALYDFIAELQEQVEMANARGHGLGLLAQRLTKRLGRGYNSGVDSQGLPWVVGPVDLARPLVMGEESVAPYVPVSCGIDLISIRRGEQIKRGFTIQLDASRESYPLALVQAADCYARAAVDNPFITMKGNIPAGWPWKAEWWRPSTPIANLAKAGALIAAAIDVIQYRKASNSRWDLLLPDPGSGKE